MTTVLYGPNVVAKQLMPEIKEPLKFASTDGGVSFEGQQVLSLKQLSEIKSDITKIIICSMFVDEILKSLLEAGFSIESIFFYNPVKERVDEVKPNIISPISEEDILYAFFDLSTHNAGFDVDMFAVSAECERKKQGKKYIQFIIVPKASKQHASAVQNNHDKHESQWRLDHIVFPYFKGIKSTLGITELAYREQANEYLSPSAFPLGFAIDTPCEKIGLKHLCAYKEEGFHFKVLEPSPIAVNLVTEFVKNHAQGKPIVTLTMREYETQQKRNNNKQSWAEFFTSLEVEGYYPTLLRDTFKSTTPIEHGLDKYDRLPMASFDLTIRMALYQCAYVNFSVSCGPSSLFYYLKSCYSVALIEYDDEVFTNTVESYKKGGFEKGKQPIFAELGKQFIYWGLDDIASIQDAFTFFKNNRVED